MARIGHRTARLLVVALVATVPFTLSGAAFALQANGGAYSDGSGDFPADNGQGTGYFFWNCRQMGGTPYEQWGYVACRYPGGYTVVCGTRGGTTHSCRIYPSASTKPNTSTQSPYSGSTATYQGPTQASTGMRGR